MRLLAGTGPGIQGERPTAHVAADQLRSDKQTCPAARTGRPPTWIVALIVTLGGSTSRLSVLEFHRIRKISGDEGQQCIRIILHGVELSPPGALGEGSVCREETSIVVNTV